MRNRKPHLAAAQIIQDAGGELVGRTRLQKVAFLMQLAGFDDEFSFEYRHYGPYSEDLAQAMDIAVAIGPVSEEERIADWGGRYSIFRLDGVKFDRDSDREAFIKEAKKIDAVVLELAATAAFLFVKEGIGRLFQGDPWQETKRRKPSKAAEGRLEQAVAAYDKLRQMNVGRKLPEITILGS